MPYAKLPLALSLLFVACGPRTYDGDCIQLDAVGVSFDVGPNDDAHDRAPSGFRVAVFATASPPDASSQFA
ncbi:MAG: hypothetical protein JNK05_17580 [Myxococcales bacterium]|nr:hypothetical protein [Myxococcales bacterium]